MGLAIYMMMYIGLQSKVTKVSEDCGNKSRQVIELQQKLEHMKQSISSSEVDRQVCEL